MAVGVQTEPLRGLFDGGTFTRRGDAGLLLVLFLGLDGIPASAVVILVVGPVAALVIGPLAALALGLLVLGRPVLGRLFLLVELLLLEIGFTLRSLLEVGFTLRCLLEIGLTFRLVVLVSFELLVLGGRLVLGDVVRPELRLLFDPAAVREPIPDPVWQVAGHVGNACDLAEGAQRIEPAQLRRLRARDPGRGYEHGSGGEHLHASMATAVRLAVRLALIRFERRLDGRSDNATHINRHG